MRQGYMNRALRSRDPRYARVLSRLGYGRRDMVAEPRPTPADPFEELAAFRSEYRLVVGRQPFHGWDAETLRAKIAAAREA